MHVVVNENLRDHKGWKNFAAQAALDLSKPFRVEEGYGGYIYKSWLLPTVALTFVSTPLDKSLEDYL